MAEGWGRCEVGEGDDEGGCEVVDLAAYRRGVEGIDRARREGARPVGVDELEEAMGNQVKAISIRLTAEQVAVLERMAPVLAEQRPDVAALTGGEVSTYAILRIAVAYGLKQLEEELAAPGPKRGGRR